MCGRGNGEFVGVNAGLCAFANGFEAGYELIKGDLGKSFGATCLAKTTQTLR